MKRAASLLVASALLGGCTTVRLDNTDRLMRRPDFPAAAKASPAWVSDALKTINQLEYQLERK